MRTYYETEFDRWQPNVKLPGSLKSIAGAHPLTPSPSAPLPRCYSGQVRASRGEGGYSQEGAAPPLLHRPLRLASAQRPTVLRQAPSTRSGQVLGRGSGQVRTGLTLVPQGEGTLFKGAKPLCTLTVLFDGHANHAVDAGEVIKNANCDRGKAPYVAARRFPLSQRGSVRVLLPFAKGD